MQYRRVFTLGGTLFFTVVTFDRQDIFTGENTVSILREAFREVLTQHPFQINAFVLLPNHLHTVWTLPEGDCNYPTRWRLIKSKFSRRWTKRPPVHSISRRKKGEQEVWQRRYWEHQIRDENDFIRHVEYIHFNPVRHELVESPGQWQFSSFHNYVRRGFYPPDWGADGNEMRVIGCME